MGLSGQWLPCFRLILSGDDFLSLWQPACFIAGRVGVGSHAGGQRAASLPTYGRGARRMTGRRRLQFAGGLSGCRRCCHWRLCGPARLFHQRGNKKKKKSRTHLLLHWLNFIRTVRHLRTDKTLSAPGRHSLCCQRIINKNDCGVGGGRRAA